MGSLIRAERLPLSTERVSSFRYKALVWDLFGSEFGPYNSVDVPLTKHHATIIGKQSDLVQCPVNLLESLTPLLKIPPFSFL